MQVCSRMSSWHAAPVGPTSACRQQLWCLPAAATHHIASTDIQETPTQYYLPDEHGKDPLAHMPALTGKRIMVTAPRQYAHKLSAKLLNAGARPLWVPGVNITHLDPTTHSAEVHQLDTILRQLMQSGHGYTHLAFTSKNGIYAVLQRLAQLAGGLEAACDVLRSCGVRICALGADGQVLLQAGLPVHVSPTEASTQGLVRMLESLGQAAGARVLCPVPFVVGGLVEPPVVPRFLTALQAARATAVRVPAYVTTTGCQADECEAEQRLLFSGQVHAIAFSSTAEAQGLIHAMGGLSDLSQAIKQHGVLLAAHGPYTAQGVAQVLGLPVPCVSANFHTFDGLVTALEAAFGSS